MNTRFQSFSKLLSRRILIINIVMISILALAVITFATIGLKNMVSAYYTRGLYGARESIEKRISKMNQDGLYQHIREIDKGLNTFNPLFKDTNEKDDKNVWAYNIVIDSQGKYIYHPDRQRIGKGNFFDDIRQTPDDLRQKLAAGLASAITEQQMIMVDGVPAYIFYVGMKGAAWTNAIVVPRDGLLIPHLITGMILLVIIVMGLMASYWISRLTIRRSTTPLQVLAKSADEVAKGNFQAPLPELSYNNEISQLRNSFGNMQQSLVQYIDQLRTTTAQKAAIENELSLAREIQLSMVPTEFPERDDIDIYGSMNPAKAVGGDLYDFFIEGDKLFFCIGDVSGKGVPAALLMTVAKNLFRAYASIDSTPDNIVTRMDNDLNRDNEECMFITILVGILDIKSGLLRYCNAGHEAPILIGKTVEALPIEENSPVGTFYIKNYLTQEFVIEPQTTVMLYTDGLNEAMDADKNLFGEDRIFDELKHCKQAGLLSPKAVTGRMIEAVRAFVGDTEQSDDLTMLCMRLKAR